MLRGSKEMRINRRITALFLAIFILVQSLSLVGGGSVSAEEVIESVETTINEETTMNQATMMNQAINPIKASALYGTTVRGGVHADKQAATGSSVIPKELLETKWAGDMSFSRRAHLEFDMSASANIDWEKVQSIKLTLFLKEHSGNDKRDTIQVLKTDKPTISEENWTWNNTIDLMENAVVIGEQTISDASTGSWVEIDVTDLKESLTADSSSPFSLALYPSAKADNGGLRFYSQHQESGKYTPYLSIYQTEYVDTIPPTVKVIGLTDGQQVMDEQISFSIEALDNIDTDPAIHISVNGEGKEGVNGLNTVTLRTGQNTILISAMDAAGNISEIYRYIVMYSKSYVIPVTGDTYTDIRERNKNFNGAKMQLKKPVGGGTTRDVYLSFDLPSDVPFVKEAGIELYLAELMGNDRTSEVISIYEVSEFDETQITSGNAPTGGEKVADAEYSRVSVNAFPNRYIRLDITEHINKKLAKQQSGLVYFALKIDHGHDQKGAYFLSKENSQTQAPRLVLVEGLPAPQLEVEGIQDQGIYSSNSIKDVAIYAKSVNENIKIEVVVSVNDELVVPNDKGLYDIPLQLGTNIIHVIASDEAGNNVMKIYTVTSLQYAQAGTYYVDSEAGNDANDGLSEESAWKSIEKLNSIQWQPGSSILFKRGGIWSGQFRPNGSGTIDAPIIVDVYGDAVSRPIINGGGISNKDTNNAFAEGAVHLYNLSYWEINGLEVTNKGAIVTEAARAGIMVVAGGNGFVEHVYIKDVYVHDVNSHDDAQKISGGIIFRGDTVDEKGKMTNIASGFRDIVVENSHIKDVAIEGLRTKTYRNGSDTGNIKNVDVIFRNNLIENILGDGIVISEIASGGLVEKNIIRKHSMSTKARNYAGLWLYQTDKVLIQYNEVYDGVNGYNDGEAFDFDISATNNIYQYNYSHNNRGGFLLTMTSAGVGNIFRYNISKNDGHGTEIFFCMNDRTAIYNNTIYIGKGMHVKYLIKENNIQNMFFKNNIVHVEGTLDNYSQMTNAYDAPNVSNNLFYPASIASLPGAPNPYSTLVTGSAKLVSPDADSIVMDTWTQDIWDVNIANFKLSADSPAIDAGVVIPNAGEHDIYGTPLYVGKPDIGAHEFTVEQVDRTKLNSLISTALSIHATAVAGTKPGEYPAAAKAELLEEIEIAQNVSEDPTATKESIDAAIVRLAGAISLFNTKIIVAQLSNYIVASDDARLTDSKKTVQLRIDGQMKDASTINNPDFYKARYVANHESAWIDQATGELTFNGDLSMISELKVSAEIEEYTNLVYSESFENGLGDFTPEQDLAMNETGPVITNKVSYHGNSSLLYNEPPAIEKIFTPNQQGIVSMMFYDDGSKVGATRAIAHVGNIRTDLLAAMGVFYDGESIGNQDNYSVRASSSASEWEDTGIVRTVGWHELKWDYTSGIDLKMYIDNQLVKTTTAMKSFDRINLTSVWDKANGRTFAFDNIKYATNDQKTIFTADSLSIVVNNPKVLTTTLTGPKSVEQGSIFSVKYGLSGVQDNFYSQKITLNYDAQLFEFIEVASLMDDRITIIQPEQQKTGEIRLVVASLGEGNELSVDADILQLSFKAKSPKVTTNGEIAISLAELGNAQGDDVVAELSSLNVEVTVKRSGVPGDVNNDEKVTVGDLAMIAAHYGKDSTDVHWMSIQQFDVNHDGKIDIVDLAMVARTILLQ